MYFDDIESEAIRFLKEATPNGEELFVGFSGGKDSIAATYIVRLSGLPHVLYHTLGGIDPPEVLKFIKTYYSDTKFLRPRFSFWHSVQTKNPPLINARWCCAKLRKEPGWKAPQKYRVLGIRSEESDRRSRYVRVNHFKKDGNGRPDHYQLYPIFNWDEADVWGYIEHRKLPYPKLYDEGFDRIGCVVCPYHTEKVHERYRQRYPAYFKLFEKVVHKWYAKRAASGRDMNNCNADSFLKDWYRGKASWYRGKKKRI